MSVKADGKPGGTNGEFQYNDRGAFAGSPLALDRAAIGATYATGTLTLAVQPTIGDTITLGALTFTYVDTFPNPGEIFIDVDVATTQANTVSVVNQGIGATSPTVGAVAFVANVSAVVASAPGTAGNGTVTTSVFTDGANFFGQAAVSGGTDGSDSDHIQAQTMELVGSSPASPLLRLQAAPGQDELAAANVFEIADADDNHFINIDAGGNFYTFRDLRMVDPTHLANFTVQSNGKMYARIPDIDDAARWQLRGSIPGSNDKLIFALRPFASKTVLINAHASGAVALEIDPSGEIGDNSDLVQAFGTDNFDLVFRLMQRGAVVIAQHVAPDDGDINTGDMALWFDQTNGAAQLMIKGKTADGTVVTGAVALI